MKTATIPSLRVDPELRAAAESVLHEGETLSGFMEKALRDGIEQRKLQREFVTRGLAGRDAARHSGEYYSADEVLASMRDMLARNEGEDRK
ncbi:YlcI/YnfO family protein [Trichloromonas acetexigens]|uniref:Prevent-host-death protein n=1 Tax=Trichloromonas acetexigens TaxID=38815 RepID=A0A550JFC9_9BACT|nr:YlcI/YnfO family protein [Desulfuromonas acetexigens]TRO81911.1 prevent-host-death protein [Desulfuromonas acetexigens]